MSAELFETPVAEAPKQKRANLLEEHAREKAGASEGWIWHSWECFPKGYSVETLYYEIKGAVTPLKQNGLPNYRKADKATAATVIITPKEHEDWKAAWEAKTGKCSECVGTGEVFKSWHHERGTEYVPCRKCGATGKAHQEAK